MIVAIGMTIALLVVVFKALKWKIATLSMIHFMELKKYTQPTEKEMEECTRYVANKYFSGLCKK